MKHDVAIQSLNAGRLRYQRGLSLIELMIAIALGIFLTWGAIQAFLSGKQTYSMQQAVSRIQENGRMAQEFLGFDIRNAGNLGCGSQNLSNNINEPGCDDAPKNYDGVNMLENAGSMEFDFGKAVYGINNSDGSATSGETFDGAGLNPPPRKGTDILITRGVTDSNVVLSDPAAAGSAQFKVDNMVAEGACFSGICKDDILVVSDCTKAKIFQATNLTANSVVHSKSGENACSSWGGKKKMSFNAGAKILKMHSKFYYVADNPATGRPGLYVQGLTGGGQELLEGVEDLQLEFGVDSDNDLVIDAWKTANNVTDAEWESWDCSVTNPDGADCDLVRAVRYSILVRSEENVLTEPQKYTFNGADVTATDRRLRQIFTSTVGIRNRLN
jgi:type IV pilus assembly protein PilW